MDIKIEIELKDSTWGFSDLLDGRELNNQTKKEIIELLKEDIGEVFDQQIEVKQLILSGVVGQSELLQEFFRKNGNAMKLLSEVFNLANKLAINGYGNEAVKMHQICTQISRKIEKLDNLNK